MHLFLIRHGETEHNIAGLLAGVSDSRLTNHGALQTQRLGKSLIGDRALRFTHVYASDLQRAYMTANEICKAQNSTSAVANRIDVVRLDLLREQDFGSLELVPWSSQRFEQALDHKSPKPDDPDYKPKETIAAMKGRANTFIDDFLTPLLSIEDEEEACVAVVSHGLFLSQLWRVFLTRFATENVNVSSEVSDDATHPLDRVSWSNTGCLELAIQLPAARQLQLIICDTDTTEEERDSPFAGAKLVVRAKNDTRHLLNLKRARGGIGSATYDQRQGNIQTFFKRPKTDRQDIV